eukprot:Amastigsp_a174948_29.p4 type:complete len:235 gc:universal Amastigsp_a174948_29:834-1538(+)
MTAGNENAQCVVISESIVLARVGAVMPQNRATSDSGTSARKHAMRGPSDWYAAPRTHLETSSTNARNSGSSTPVSVASSTCAASAGSVSAHALRTPQISSRASVVNSSSSGCSFPAAPKTPPRMAIEPAAALRTRNMGSAPTSVRSGMRTPTESATGSTAESSFISLHASARASSSIESLASFVTCGTITEPSCSVRTSLATSTRATAASARTDCVPSESIVAVSGTRTRTIWS